MELVQYNLPDNWYWKLLDDISEKITDGTHHSPKVQYSEWELGRFKYITSKNIKNYGMKLDNISYIDENVHNEIHARCAPELEDQLLTKDGAMTGTCCLNELDEQFSLLSSVALIKQNRSVVLPKYLNYYLQSNVGQSFLLGDISGAAITRTNIRKLKSIPVPLAPIAEQEHIVEKLDALLSRIDTATDHLLESVALADALYESAINEQMIMAIEKASLIKVDDRIAKIQTGTTPPTKQPEFYENGDMNWFSPSDFGEHDVLNDSKKKLNQKAFGAGKARTFEAGTVLLVAIGATIGKIGYLEKNASSNQQITGMKFNSDILPRYAYYWFRYIKPEILASASTATLPIINQKGIKALSFCAPGKELQQKICEKIDNASVFRKKVKSEIKEKIELMKTLKASILDSAFKGEL
jgi:type I restriction enzyme S subunit